MVLPCEANDDMFSKMAINYSTKRHSVERLNCMDQEKKDLEKNGQGDGMQAVGG
jgi:hypothetical protein